MGLSLREQLGEIEAKFEAPGEPEAPDQETPNQDGETPDQDGDPPNQDEPPDQEAPDQEAPDQEAPDQEPDQETPEPPKMSRRDRRIQQLVDEKKAAKTELEQLRAEVARLKSQPQQPQQTPTPQTPPEYDYEADPTYRRLIDRGYEDDAARDMADLLRAQREEILGELAPLRQRQVADEQQSRISALAAEMETDGYQLSDEWDAAIGATLQNSEALQALLATHPQEALLLAYRATPVPDGIQAATRGDRRPGRAPAPPGRRPGGGDPSGGVDWGTDVRSALGAAAALLDRRGGSR